MSGWVKNVLALRCLAFDRWGSAVKKLAAVAVVFAAYVVVVVSIINHCCS